MTPTTRLVQLLDLTGEVAIVTGAAQGFGAAIGYRLAEAGATVVIADYRGAAAEQTAKQIAAATGARVIGAQVDVTDDDSVAALMASTNEKVGPVQILVNNAGVFSNVVAQELATAEFARILEVNVTGYFIMTREFFKQRPAGQRAAVVNVASVDALQPSAPGLAHYTTSKHAIAGLTKSLAMELAPQGVRVNAVCPGASMTEGAMQLITEGAPDGIDVQAQWSGIQARTPLGRLSSPDEIARVVLFLASELSSMVTGALVPVDGGILIQPLEGYPNEGDSA